MEGLIVASKYGTYSVLADGIIYQVTARGVFKNKKIKPLVGDKVSLSEGNFVIEKIFERKSTLNRPTIANIDQILIVFSLREPSFSYHMALKYLTHANKNHIPASLVLTKSDICDEQEEIENITKAFESIGIKVHVVSNKTKEGIEEIYSLFEDKITCLMGQSGVGKSSLLNVINPDYQRSIGEYSKALGRGKHETKETILLPYRNGFIADTPGFSSLDLDLSKEDLAAYYPSFTDLYTECYFSNCLHISEKKCAVKDYLEENNIPKVIYDTYLKLSEEAIYESKKGY